MIFENLVATEISANAHRTLNVRLDLTSFERLQKARSSASALARWRSAATLTGGTAALSPARGLNVQNVFRVPLGGGTRGWVFILSQLSAPLSWRYPPDRPRHLQISGPNTGRLEGAPLHCIERMAGQTARFASASPNCEAIVVFSLPLRTFQHCLRECGTHGRVMIPRSRLQQSLPFCNRTGKNE